MRISSPPFLYPCHFGIDVDSQENLIACHYTCDEICQQIGADSLAYLSIEDVNKIALEAHCKFCNGCFNGEYPVPVPEEIPKDKFELPISRKEKEDS